MNLRRTRSRYIDIYLQTCYILAEGYGSLTIAAVAAVALHRYGEAEYRFASREDQGVAMSFGDDDAVLCGYQASTREALPLADVSS